MHKWFQNHFLLFAGLLFTVAIVSAAKFNIVYEDGGNFGFNAATAREPVGGNDSTTLGQQRRNVLEKAAEIWSQYLESDVEIEISAKFEAFCSTSLFTTNDFTNLKAFVLKFKNPTDQVSQFLESQFDFSTQRLLAAHDESEEPSERLQDAIIQELNWVLQGDSIYEANRFFGVSEQMKNLAEQDREVIDPICLNRLLLLAAYPLEIRSSNRNGGILASGGPAGFHESFTNSPVTEVWYASALANSIAGEDLDPNKPDIEIKVNALIDVPEAKALDGYGFYYGYDGRSGLKANLLATLLHEMGHGLGFISSIDAVNGNFIFESKDQQQGESGWPDSFSLLLKDTKTKKLLSDMTDAEREEAISNNPVIVFDGAYTQQASQRILRYRISLSSTLFADDFTDLKSLVLKLKNRTDSVSQFLRDQFDASAQSLLSVYDESEEPSETLKNAIVEELNWLLQGDSIYEETRFDGINLSTETEQLLEQNPEGEDLILLNRLLLEDAYPQEIKENQMDSNDGMRLTVNGSEGFSGNFKGAAPEFGLGIPPWGLSGQIILVNDGAGENTSDACEDGFVNANEIRGRIALIDRGDCFFVEKVKRAENVGAIAAIVANNVEGGVLNMGLGDVYTDIAIPSVFISKADGDLIKAALSSEKLRVSIFNQKEFSGTQDGTIRVHTPTTAELGSSLSHWSLDAFPDLLMEPESPRLFRPDLDLTLPALCDIGWKISNIPFPHLSFELWADEHISGAEKGFDDDPDADGSVNLAEYAFGTDPEDVASIPAPMEFSSSSNDENLFTLRYKRNPAPADIIFSVTKAGSLTTPFTETISGCECRQWNRFVDEAGFETIEFQIESTAAQQFFTIEAKKHSE